MRAGELRIGNWVKFDGCPVQIRELQYMSKLDVYLDSNVNLSIYKPIPLTEEILVKCGFERTSNEKLFEFDGWQVYLSTIPLFRIIGCSLCECRSVHNLQNIMHALTCSELEISL